MPDQDELLTEQLALSAPEIQDAAKVEAYKSAMSAAAASPAKAPAWYDNLQAPKQDSSMGAIGKGLANLIAAEGEATAKLSAAEPLRRFKNKQKDAQRAALRSGAAQVLGALIDKPKQQAAAEMELAKFRGAQQMADRKMSNEETQTTDAREAKANELQFKREDAERAGREFAEKMKLDYDKLSQDDKQHASEMGLKSEQLKQQAEDNKANRGLRGAELVESRRYHDLLGQEHRATAADRAAEKAEAKAEKDAAAINKEAEDFDKRAGKNLEGIQLIDGMLAGKKEGKDLPGTSYGDRIANAIGLGGVVNSPEAQANQQSMERLRLTVSNALTGASSSAQQDAAIKVSVLGDPLASPKEKEAALKHLRGVLVNDVRGASAGNPRGAEKVVGARQMSGVLKDVTPTAHGPVTGGVVRVTSPDGKISQSVPAVKAAKLKTMGWAVEE